jgi:hypothetical protein
MRQLGELTGRRYDLFEYVGAPEAERVVVVHCLAGKGRTGVACAAYLVYCLFYVPTLSVSNSLAFANLANPARDFGFVRMGGTIGWVLVSWPFVFLLSAKATPEQVRSIFLVGGAVSLALPFLDCFLNTNGTALASGAALPLCYGTWFWGLGLNPGRLCSMDNFDISRFTDDDASLGMSKNTRMSCLRGNAFTDRRVLVVPKP